jgi:hypothetical protein
MKRFEVVISPSWDHKLGHKAIFSRLTGREGVSIVGGKKNLIIETTTVTATDLARHLDGKATIREAA